MSNELIEISLQMQRYEVSDERPNFFAKRIERIKKNHVFRIEKMTETKYKLN